MIPEYESEQNYGVTIGGEKIVDSTKPEIISIIEPTSSDLKNNTACLYVKNNTLYIMWKNGSGECFTDELKTLSTRPIEPKE